MRSCFKYFAYIAKNDKKYAFITEKHTIINKKKKSLKKRKKGIDKRGTKWYNARVASREGAIKRGEREEIPREPERISRDANRRETKKLEKT